MRCPCGTGNEYEACCGLLIDGGKAPATAEALMRSRYTAYTKGKVDYLESTLHPRRKKGFEAEHVKRWSRDAQWQGLRVVSTEGGLETDESGTVEFVARYVLKGESIEHHERAEFHRVQGRWYFFDGKMVGTEQVRRTEPKVGRNDPCTCGSGKKYKKCCGA